MNENREKELKFAKLTCEAKACVLCSRMANSIRVIGPASGSLNSPILIIGEAPGRLGADASAIPFHGDRAGDNFEALLEQVGLTRHDCFITNAALCNPKDDKGNNSTPTRSELQNCSGFLKRQIDLVDPRIVVTLGGQALNSIKAIEDHEIDLANGVRKKWNWYGRVLMPLFHPGQRAMIHRSFFNQLADYRFLAETYSRLSKPTKKTSSPATPTSHAVAHIVEKLADQPEGITYFALHKLFYLAEYECYRRTQRRMTTAYIVRQKEGPYVFELHIKKLRKAIGHLETWTQDDKLMLRASDRANLFNQPGKVSEEFEEILEYVSKKYGNKNDQDLKRIVYLTAPMRQILSREKRFKENLFNRAIDFSAIKSDIAPNLDLSA